jgi:hypothetical protein
MKQICLVIILLLVMLQSNLLKATDWNYTPTEKFHTIVINETSLEPTLGLENGDKIGFFYDSAGFARCAGSAIWQGRTLIFKVYGKTSTQPGFSTGQVFRVRVLSEGCVKLTDASFKNDHNYFTEGDTSELISLSVHNPTIAFPLELCFSGSYEFELDTNLSEDDITFKGSEGLKINAKTGKIDLDNSTVGRHKIELLTDLCLDKKVFSLTVRSKPVSGLSKTYFLCSQGSVTINSNPNLSYYKWSDGSFNPFTTLNQTGKYWLEFRDAFGCLGVDSFDVVRAELNLQPIKWKKANCRTYELTAPDNWLYYEWSNGERSKTASVQKAGNYFVKLTSKEGCQHIEKITIDEKWFDPEQLVFNIEQAKCNSGAVMRIDGKSLSNFVEPYSFEFSNMTNGQFEKYHSPVIENLPVGLYRFVLRDAVGCFSKEQIIQIVKDKDCGNAVITPDGDGIDDFFYIPYQGSAKIYDKFGVLRNQISIPAIWDGKDSNNISLPMGAYLIVCNGSQDIEVTVLK